MKMNKNDQLLKDSENKLFDLIVIDNL